MLCLFGILCNAPAESVRVAEKIASVDVATIANLLVKRRGL